MDLCTASLRGRRRLDAPANTRPCLPPHCLASALGMCRPTADPGLLPPPRRSMRAGAFRPCPSDWTLSLTPHPCDTPASTLTHQIPHWPVRPRLFGNPTPPASAPPCPAPLPAGLCLVAALLSLPPPERRIAGCATTGRSGDAIHTLCHGRTSRRFGGAAALVRPGGRSAAITGRKVAHGLTAHQPPHGGLVKSIRERRACGWSGHQGQWLRLGKRAHARPV